MYYAFRDMVTEMNKEYYHAVTVVLNDRIESALKRR